MSRVTKEGNPCMYPAVHIPETGHRTDTPLSPTHMRHQEAAGASPAHSAREREVALDVAAARPRQSAQRWGRSRSRPKPYLSQKARNSSREIGVCGEDLQHKLPLVDIEATRLGFAPIQDGERSVASEPCRSAPEGGLALARAASIRGQGVSESPGLFAGPSGG